MALRAGQMLQGRYRIVSMLGQGGMGAIYQAWDTRLEIYLAIKEMRPQPGLDPHVLMGLREQFQQEATVLARLSHPHLVRVNDFFEQDGNVYLVMEFVAGESLAERIERLQSLPESQVLAWGDQLLDALAYCHARGVFHRDVKPQNVIIGPGERATLVDFGLVKLWDPLDPHTRTAMRGMGTPEYAPPEQYDSGMAHTDARSDIYSLGATLYHALGGQVPPTATRRIVSPEAFPALRTLNPQVSREVEAILMQALELRPDARFQSASEMRHALADAARSRPAGPSPVSHRSSASAMHPVAQATVSEERGRAQRAGKAGLPWLIIGLAGGGAVLLIVALTVLALGIRQFVDGNRPAGEVPAAQTPTGMASDATSATEHPVPTDAVPVAATAGAGVTSTPSVPPVLTEPPNPTDTPPPTDTPLPTDTPSPTDTPTPACPPVSGPFASIWESNREQLGCARNEARTVWIAEEAFESGRMFWREDTDRIIALYNGGGWADYPDTWNSGDPDYSCPETAAAETPPTPIRGFGKVWCEHQSVRDGLGSATTVERGFNASLQDFDRGWIVRTDDGRTYMATSDGSWRAP